MSAGSGSAWAPLAAKRHRAGAGGLRHVVSVDAATLQRDAAAAQAAHATPQRVAFSMPASPRGGAGARPPQPLNLRGVAGRLQVHQRAQEAAQQRQRQAPQLSPVLEALLDSVPTPYAAHLPAAQQQQQERQQAQWEQLQWEEEQEEVEEIGATPQHLPQHPPQQAPAAVGELTADDLVDLGNCTRCTLALLWLLLPCCPGASAGLCTH